MKNFLIFILMTISFITGISNVFADENTEERKKEIIALYGANNLEAAYKEISKIPENDRDYELWYLLGNLAQDFSNSVNAVFYLQKSIILKPDFDKAHYNLGNIYLSEKKYNSAINEYKEAIKYKKDFPYYYYNMGCAYLELKDYKSAKNAFLKAVKYKPEADFYYNLAIAYKNLGKEKEQNEAVEMYNKLKKESAE